MSMKTQLRLVKAFKEMENKAKTGTRTVVRTGFRRKKATVQDNPDSSAPEMLRDIWNQKETPPHFFLDGYNIIGYWNKLKKKRDKGDMSGARDTLFQEVSQFAHYRGCQCTLVYDAAGNVHGSPNTQAELRREGVEVVFVRDESADSYLEARAAELGSLQSKDGVRPPRCYIATSDRNVQSISGSRGAVIMSSTLFIQELKRAKREVEMDLNDMRQGSFAGTSPPLPSPPLPSFTIPPSFPSFLPPARLPTFLLSLPPSLPSSLPPSSPPARPPARPPALRPV